MSQLIFASSRDCRSYLASAENVRDLLLPAETAVHEKWLPAETVRVTASCRDSQQEAETHGQSLQEGIYQAQQSRQEARDRGHSQRKPNMTDSLCRKQKLADSFIPCDESILAFVSSSACRKGNIGELFWHPAFATRYVSFATSFCAR